MTTDEQTTNDSGPTAAAVADEEVAKMNLVTQTISTNCASSSHEILQKINTVVNESNDDGSKLVATILSGGITNYSYKVHVDKNP